MITSLIVDYGGTWIRVYAFNKNDKQVRSFKTASVPIFKFPQVLKNLIRRWKIKNLSTLMVGAKGTWTNKNQKKFLERRLKSLAEYVVILSDVEMAYLLTLGNQPGIVLLAGTGSIAYGKDACGHWARAGGKGPLKGDEGSGHWIGKEWMQFKKVRSDLKSVREIANLAPRVIRKAQQKDPVAGKIIEGSFEHLNRLICEVQNKLHFKKPVPLAVWGGLFQNRFFMKKFKMTIMKGGRCLGENF